ncbi:MAG TPA: flagellar hook-length control protein FliK [Phycisphaerales bacterium]|nr:flagellar hook-length control protein FliK [Phycisphaerales bacterium]
MTQALQAQPAGTNLLTTERVRAQAGSTLSGTSKDSIWQIDFASAKPAAKSADSVDNRANFAHALHQKKQETRKAAEKKDAAKPTDRSEPSNKTKPSDDKKTDRADSKDTDKAGGSDKTDDASGAADEQAQVATSGSTTAAKQSAQNTAQTPEAKVDDSKRDAEKDSDPKADAKDATDTKSPPQPTDAQAAAIQPNQVDLKQAAPSTPDPSTNAAASQAAAQAAAQDASKQTSNTAENGKVQVREASTSAPANIAQLDQLLRRRAPRAQAAATDGKPKGDDAKAQTAAVADPSVQGVKPDPAAAKSKAKSAGEAQDADARDVASASKDKPPEPASATAPKPARQADDDAPEPAPAVAQNPAPPQATPNASVEVVAPQAAQMKPVETAVVTKPDEAVAPVVEATRPDAGTPSADASRTITQVQQVGVPARASSQAAPQNTPTQDAAAQFQKTLQAQVDRGIALAMQQARAAAGTGDVNIGAGGIVLRLYPEQLGQLKVQLKFESGSKGGSGVRARFEASSGKAKAILDSSMDSLKSALEERGLRVDEVVVAQSPRMPERDVGLPTPAGHPDAANAGAGFAGMDQGSAHSGADTGGVPGNERRAAAESGGADADAGVFAERPVTLGGLPWTVGSDGRIRVDALV